MHYVHVKIPVGKFGRFQALIKAFAPSPPLRKVLLGLQLH